MMHHTAFWRLMIGFQLAKTIGFQFIDHSDM